MENVGCKVPYFLEDAKLPNCSSKEQMQQALDPLHYNKNYFPNLPVSEHTPPCRILKEVAFDYHVHDATAWANSNQKRKKKLGTFFLEVNFKTVDSYKETDQIRGFNFGSLVGNAGGYIGLFMGYTLLQIPDLLDFVFRRLRC